MRKSQKKKLTEKINDLKNYNLRITALRQKKGITIEELSKSLGIPWEEVMMWEMGKVVPEADMALRLAEKLETSVSVLFGEKEDATMNKMCAIIFEQKASHYNTLAENGELK